METEFKVGDRVRIRDVAMWQPDYSGLVGTVKRLKSHADAYIEVLLDEDPWPGMSFLAEPEELELVEEEEATN